MLVERDLRIDFGTFVVDANGKWLLDFVELQNDRRLFVGGKFRMAAFVEPIPYCE